MRPYLEHETVCLPDISEHKMVCMPDLSEYGYMETPERELELHLILAHRAQENHTQMKCQATTLGEEGYHL